jgi:hypothetical protein
MNSYFIPAGPKNLQALFPALSVEQIDSYFLVMRDATGLELATSVMYKLDCCCSEGYVRIEFMNDDGTKDGVNFGKPSIVQEAKSSMFQKHKNYPETKEDYGLRKFNLRANDTYECSTTCYDEKAMQWMSELFRSPVAYLHQMNQPQNQGDFYLPINIVDGTFDLQKNSEEYSYLVTIKFTLANIYSSIRT